MRSGRTEALPIHRGHDATAFAQAPTQRGIVFWIVLIPGYSQLCLSSLIDPLRIANSLLRQRLFQWRLVSLDGEPVTCASDISIGVDTSLSRAQAAFGREACDAVVVCSGDGVERFGSGMIAGLLRRCSRQSTPIYTLGTATWLLADAGLLKDTRCTIHWSKIAALSETFYGLTVDDVLFLRQGRLVTCAGELAAFDLAIDLVQGHCGAEIAHDICRHVTAERWRSGASAQSKPRGIYHRNTNTMLVEIMRLMERNLETPIPLDQICEQVRLSRRQVQRLFSRHLSTTPWRYYIELRLHRARQLIELTDKPIMDIAIACGFLSPSYFSRLFRENFKIQPRKLRAP